MSDLSNVEKRSLERLFDMGSGYVLDFSNRTFEEFVFDSSGKGIYDTKYDSGSGSKANRLGDWSRTTLLGNSLKIFGVSRGAWRKSGETTAS